MNAQELVERYRRIFNNPNLSEDIVCELIDKLAMHSYWMGHLHRKISGLDDIGKESYK
jgi:hypothetical protein